MKTLSLVLISCCLLILSCRKDSFIDSPDARITITADTLRYDTVFATAGSITQSFKIINENDQKLRLSSVKLMGGNSSAYKINVDGTTGPEVNNLEIEANDSLYVFVQVNINQNTANLPFIVRDSIQVSYNGNNRKVQLEAWGQNAHFFRNKQILTNETWINDLPYVILGYLYIDTSQTLTINKGCRIYMHADAPVIVDGTLQVNGAKDTADRVYFRGDRLDDPYKDFPAGWPGIYFLGSSINNVLNYAVIKNGYQSIGVQDPATNANPKLTLNECIIDNAYETGIIAINSSIRATNCLVSNCGKNLYLVKGGNYQFIHCTVVTISNSFIQHREPVLTLSNAVSNAPPLAMDALFRNCILWGENGTVDDEVFVEKKTTAAVFNVVFDQVLWKVTANPANTTITPPVPINNLAPTFDSINTSRNYYDFRLKTGSRGINAGINAGVTIDLDGKARPVGLPDLGCYEKN
jgi:hypothetical protein